MFGRKTAGFTMIELLVTVVIVGALTMIAVPGMTDLVRDARLSTQTDLLVSTLNTARLEAIRRRVPVTVCPTVAPNALVASCSGSVGDWAKGMLIWDPAVPDDPLTAADDRILQRIQTKTGLTVTLSPTSASPTAVVFSGTLGSASRNTFTLCITGRKEQQVEVWPSGHVSKQTTATVCG